MANTQINITANGTKTLAAAGKYCDRNIDVNVNVPVPSGYIKPAGSKTITENGTHDVTQYASAVVNVAGKPTQFTNLYDPANVTIDTRIDASSSIGYQYNADTETNYIRIPYHHKADEPLVLRIRGISTVRSKLSVVVFKQDGVTKENHYTFNSTSYFNLSYDEYGDTTITFTNSITYREWYYMEFNFQYPTFNSATTALTGPIITINEPIGNGGYVG
jgi:hypothetical protein